MSRYAFTVTVRSQYLPEHSDSQTSQFAFSYTVTIRNTGELPAQLISRYWLIVDSDGVAQEVKGLGVVGHQPLLRKDEHFEYTSWTTTATPVGTMQGHYFCVAEDGTHFEAAIPAFSLAMPRTLH